MRKHLLLRVPMKSPVANIILTFTVTLVVLNTAAVAVGALLDVQIGPRHDPMLRLLAIFVAIEMFMTREARTPERIELHAFAFASALICTALPLALLLAVDVGELVRVVGEPLKREPLFVLLGWSAFIGIQYFLTYWAARFGVWNHLRTVAKAKANRR